MALLLLVYYYTVMAQLSVMQTQRVGLGALVIIGLLDILTRAVLPDEAAWMWHVPVLVAGVLSGSYATSTLGAMRMQVAELYAWLLSAAVVSCYTLSVLLCNVTRLSSTLCLAMASAATLALMVCCAVWMARRSVALYLAYVVWAVTIIAPSALLLLCTLLWTADPTQLEFVCVVLGAVVAACVTLLVALWHRVGVFSLRVSSVHWEETFSQRLAGEVRDSALTIKQKL
jgi:hypothetical protein